MRNLKLLAMLCFFIAVGMFAGIVKDGVTEIKVYAGIISLALCFLFIIVIIAKNIAMDRNIHKMEKQFYGGDISGYGNVFVFKMLTALCLVAGLALFAYAGYKINGFSEIPTMATISSYAPSIYKNMIMGGVALVAIACVLFVITFALVLYNKRSNRKMGYVDRISKNYSKLYDEKYGEPDEEL